MPHVTPHPGHTPRNTSTREDIARTHRADKPRDDLSGAFGGRENGGPRGQSTKVKSRKSGGKTP